MDSVVGIAQRAVSFPFEVVDFWQSGTFNVSRAAEIARLANISYALGDASFLDYDNNERHIFSWRRTNLEQIHDLAANGVFIVATFGQLQQFSALDARGQVVQRLREFQRAIHSEYELDIIANGSNSAKQQPLSARSAVALQRYPALAQIVRSAATQSPDRPPMVDQLAACVFVRTGTRPPYMARTCSATKTHQDIADMSMLAIHPCVQSQGISLNILEQAFVVAGVVGFAAVRSDVLACKPWLREFYMKNGWSLTGRTKGWEPQRAFLIKAEFRSLIPQMHLMMTHPASLATDRVGNTTIARSSTGHRHSGHGAATRLSRL